MTNHEFPGPEPRRSRLRATVASVQAVISRLPAGASPHAAELHGAWKDLVDLLALGPEPELRECPKCHRMCMREATACGHCFGLLEPLGPALASAHGTSPE
jgi:hypothetical protein